MDDKKPERSIEEITKEYQDLTFKAGAMQYEIDCRRRDLDLLNGQLRDLNLEYISAKERHDAAKASAEQPKEEPSA
jgi:hypothetical protein